MHQLALSKMTSKGTLQSPSETQIAQDGMFQWLMDLSLEDVVKSAI